MINAILEEDSSLECLSDSACNAEFKADLNTTMSCIENKTNNCKNSNKTYYVGSCYCECKVTNSTNNLYLKIMNAYNND